jgi:hypothetical protein
LHAMPTSVDSTKERALKLLAAGEVTLTEAARLACESKQRVDYWTRSAGISPLEARAAYLDRLWARDESASLYDEIVDALVRAYGPAQAAVIRGKIAFALKAPK